ncbi:hypothetical protein D9M69_573430 [compost metagenome]
MFCPLKHNCFRLFAGYIDAGHREAKAYLPVFDAEQEDLTIGDQGKLIFVGTDGGSGNLRFKEGFITGSYFIITGLVREHVHPAGFYPLFPAFGKEVKGVIGPEEGFAVIFFLFTGFKGLVGIMKGDLLGNPAG